MTKPTATTDPRPRLTRKRIAGLELIDMIAETALFNGGADAAERDRIRTARQWIRETVERDARRAAS